MSQKQKNNNPEQIRPEYDDEIDLFELMQRIWKWKWLTVIIVVFFILVTLLYNVYKIKSSTQTELTNQVYTTQVVFKVGSLLGQGIDTINYNSPTITGIFKNLEKKYSKRFMIINTNSITVDFKNENVKDNLNKNNFSIKFEPLSTLYTLTVNSTDKKLSIELIEYIAKQILGDHEKLYTDGLNKLNNNIEYIKKHEKSGTSILYSVPFLLDSYNYKTELISGPRLLPQEEVIPAKGTRLKTKLVLALFASLFLGIFLSLFVDYIVTQKRARSK